MRAEVKGQPRQVFDHRVIRLCVLSLIFYEMFRK